MSATISITASVVDTLGEQAVTTIGGVITTTMPGGGGTVGDGWTIFTPTAPVLQGSNPANPGTNQIYVANAGLDSNPGTQLSPVRTIAHGASLLRNGHDDWLLLNRGDVFLNDLPNIGNSSGSGMVVTPAWSTAGTHTVSGVMLFGYYGNAAARPQLKISQATLGDGGACIEHTGSDSFSNIAVNGWDFYCFSRDPGNVGYVSGDSALHSSAIANFVGGQNLLVEDCLMHFFSLAVDWEPGAGYSGLVFRRNVIVDQYLLGSSAGHSQGIFLAGAGTGNLITGIVFDENCFDHNGWNSSVSGADQATFNHNIYMAIPGTDGTTIYRGNILANDPGGVQFRPGGTVYNNFFVLNASHLVGGTNLSTVTYNVVQKACDITGVNASVQGFGLNVIGALPSSLIDHNIVSNELSTSGSSFGIKIDPLTQNSGTNITGNLNSNNQVTNVWNGGVGAGNGVGNEGWPPGTPITGTNIPASTTVLSATGFDGNGAQGTLTISHNATATTTGVALTVPALNYTISNNIIYNQLGGIVDNGTGTTQSGNANFPTGGGSYPAPTRSTETYDTLLGGPGTVTDFLAKARGQSKQNWNTAYMANAVNNYIRFGFNFPQL
jgi:hypothetical protein